jgi:hypothetical protein
MSKNMTFYVLIYHKIRTTVIYFSVCYKWEIDYMVDSVSEMSIRRKKDTKKGEQNKQNMKGRKKQNKT